MTFQFEKLFVYPKAIDFADPICSATESFPRGYGFLVDQLTAPPFPLPPTAPKVTAALPKLDRRNFFMITYGSVQECVPLLELARRRSLFDDAEHGERKAQLEDIA
ncbi:four helix bundle protein [Blastopirellula marina]|uniref:Uncharacterized protein n=1 Tax=Blastopirellula marina DSM 3645 TaxID=314230 RepID=A3ZXZ6_9BACT|nr:four helix bundle protein [Blastopirellula marina]EAQ78707.1 hypothetical protein DSM3645_07940 [Blastopirellula marina DSM 3645]